MTVTTRDNEGDLPEEPAAAATPTPADFVAAPESAPSLLHTTADRCPVCSAELAPDQRYCVECGTRRGKARFALAGETSGVAAAGAPGLVASGWSRLTVLLAVIVVLLALGIGILIGNSGSSTPQPLKVQLSGATLATSGTSTTGGSSTAKSGSSGSSSTTCTAGSAGCKNGKQTTNFFSGS